MNETGARERAEALHKRMFTRQPGARVSPVVVNFALAFAAAEAKRLPVTELKALCGTCETCAESVENRKGSPDLWCFRHCSLRKPTDGCTDHEPKEVPDE